MNNNYRILDTYRYSTEAHLVKTKLDAENIRTMLMDETTIDSDPLISNAIGGVKLLVHHDDAKKALKIYNDFRSYIKDKSCPKCNSNKILIGPLHRKNLFYMLFPFFEAKRYICNDCQTIFK